jgi:transposase
MARHSTQAQHLMQLAGVGETTATALLSTVGNGHDFASGRSFSAWLGLVPGQYSSGGKAAPGTHHQGRRRLPAQPARAGSRAVLAAAMNTKTSKQDPLSRWAAAWPSAAATGAPWWP